MISLAHSGEKVGIERLDKLSTGDKTGISLLKNRTSYLNAPVKKIWESDWTLLIP
jgi:hypothetical protein